MVEAAEPTTRQNVHDQITERVKDIPGYEGLYAVTEDGRVWSYPREWSAGSRTDISFSHDGIWLRPCVTGGYLRVGLSKDGKARLMAVHRLVAMTWLDPVEGKTLVNHIDGDKKNNSRTNLEWCTFRENQDHAVVHDLHWHPRGTLHNKAKLKDEDVLDIRMFSAAGMTCAAIAKGYPVSKSTIERVVSGKMWSHVVGPKPSGGMA